MTDETPPRSIETEIELDAPVEDVWKALTDGEALANWFPLEAKVKPGVGGSVWVSWGEGMAFDSPITAWEENRHLRLVHADPTPPKHAADAKREGMFIPFQVAVDYHLEVRGRGTVLRLVHSGFATGGVWDNQYDGTVRGWEFELGGLKHYLERHPGETRRVLSAKAVIDGMSLADAWTRLMSADGFLAEGSIAGLAPGDAYRVRTAAGDELAGVVRINRPPRDLCSTVDNLNDALLRLRVDEACFTQAHAEVNMFLSTYGLDPAHATALEARNQSMLDKLFQPAETPQD